MKVYTDLPPYRGAKFLQHVGTFARPLRFLDRRKCGGEDAQDEVVVD